jgi:hypothetical protein
MSATEFVNCGDVYYRATDVAAVVDGGGPVTSFEGARP